MYGKLGAFYISDYKVFVMLHAAEVNTCSNRRAAIPTPVLRQEGTYVGSENRWRLRQPYMRHKYKQRKSLIAIKVEPWETTTDIHAMLLLLVSWKICGLNIYLCIVVCVWKNSYYFTCVVLIKFWGCWYSIKILCKKGKKVYFLLDV